MPMDPTVSQTATDVIGTRVINGFTNPPVALKIGSSSIGLR
jgi:hypothetical protein